MAGSDEQETPQELFDQLNAIFSFDLDAAASDSNHKVDRYFARRDDALSVPWDASRVWLNPPYSRGQLIRWVNKAIKESQIGTTVVMLAPCDSSTDWFRLAWKHAAFWCFCNKRLKFNGAASAAKTANWIVVFWDYPTFASEFHYFNGLSAIGPTLWLSKIPYALATGRTEKV